MDQTADQAKPSVQAQLAMEPPASVPIRRQAAAVDGPAAAGEAESLGEERETEEERLAKLEKEIKDTMSSTCSTIVVYV